MKNLRGQTEPYRRYYRGSEGIGTTPELAEADAREQDRRRRCLDAAAPDLLEAAKRLLAEEGNLTTCTLTEYLAYRALEAAVNKAERRTP